MKIKPKINQKKKGAVTKMMTDTGYMIMKGVDNLKKNYGYYKMGKKEQFMKEKRERAERNIKGIMDVNPEMGGRMKQEYEILKKKGVY